MSASTTFARHIAERLTAHHTATLGDGSATEFALAHGLGTKYLYLSLRVGETNLVNGTDYTVALTSENVVTITALGAAPGLEAWSAKVTPLRLDASPMGDAYVAGTVPIVGRRTKERGNDTDAAAAQRTGLAIFVMPVLPKGVNRGVPFLFFDRAELRVRIVETPALNGSGADAYDLMEDVMAALHWHLPAGHAHPLEALDPELVEGVGQSEDAILHGQLTRIIDCPFVAHFGQLPATAETT